MSEALYERYKDALRRGHVATLRGRYEEAVEAYRAAAAIATERPLPFSSLGSIHLRLGRIEEALTAFDAALERAPRDEAALVGRGEALMRAGRAAEAAGSFDLAAEVQEAGGRPLDALDTARRALELAWSASRRRDLERLAAALGDRDLDREARAIHERAMRALETRTGPEASVGGGAEAAEAMPAGAEVVTEPEAGAEPGEAAGGSDATSAGPDEPVTRDPAALSSAADAALEAGEPGRATELLLAAARAYHATGRFDAALDACYRALATAPGDLELHLELVDLYNARGWGDLAAEKLALLARLVELDEDTAAAERIRAVALAGGAGRPGPADTQPPAGPA